MAQIVAPAKSRDAVIVLPGIMGSELVEVATNRVLWGLANVGWYARAWMTGELFDELRLTDEERAGRAGRITARRLLRFPAFAPVLRGAEPYTRLLNAVRRVMASPDAVFEFPYDWRLPVPFNAALLARAAEQHLKRWRTHRDGDPKAKLVLVAHSMGGLVARYFTGVLGGEQEVRATVTLGTPFYGSTKAVRILNSGQGGPVPLPHRRLRDLSATLPGVYDLLPGYRCVDEGSSARRLTPSDVAALGGDPELAAASQATGERLSNLRDSRLRMVVGVSQPTAQSLVLRDGIAEEREYVCEDDEHGLIVRVDRGGDSTVYREAAAPAGAEPVYLPQTHGMLAKAEEAITHVCAIITERPLGPPLGGPGFGIAVPDVVTVGTPFDVAVTGVPGPMAVGCRVVNAGDGALVARPLLVPRDDSITARVVLPRQDVYRIEMKGGGFSTVSQLVMAVSRE